MKKFVVALVIIVLFLVCVSVSGNLIIKSVITTAATRIIGAPVHIDGLSLNIISSTIRIFGLKIYNPPGFPEGLLLSCPKINVIYDRATLFKPKRHVLLVDIDLKEMGPTKNKEGILNVDSLKIVRHARSSVPVLMQVDLVTLSIGKIVYKDYTVGAEPSVRVYDINRHKSYKGIPTAQQLVLLMLSAPMQAALIKNAEIYGIAALTGIAAVPVAIVATFIGKDNVRQIIDADHAHVYEISLEVVKRMGTITKEDPADGVIKANVNGSMIALILRDSADHKTEITISARKYMFPKLDIAGGVLYQILDKLR